jgi:beta-N-acetylhexosaminidase
MSAPPDDAVSRLASVSLVGLPAAGLTDEFRRSFASRPWAGVLLFRRHFRTLPALPALIAELRTIAAGRRILVAVDEEGGFVSQLAPELPVPPAARVLGRAASDHEIERIAATVGGWLCALGVDVNFAPVLDVDGATANPVIGPRAYSSDPARVATAAAAALRGYREGGVLACAKHFPGHGGTTTDSHLSLPTIAAGRGEIDARDLVPFRDALHLAPMVMTAHVRYPALDPDLPATLSPAIVTGLLRETLGAHNVVVTDAMEMKGVADVAPGGEGVLRALAAGCDLVLQGEWTPEFDASLDRAAARWTAGGEAVLPAARWEAARGGIEGLLAAALAAERWAHGDGGAPAGPAALAHLVPPSWEPMMLALCRRALAWLAPPDPVALDRIEVLEPAWSAGPSIAELLLEAGVPARGRWFAAAASGAAPGRTASVAEDFASLRRLASGPVVTGGGADADGTPDPLVVALPRRTPLDDDEARELHALCATRPVVLVALEQDAFLADYPEAAGRLSACDSTPAMRRAVAQELAGLGARVG